VECRKLSRLSRAGVISLSTSASSFIKNGSLENDEPAFQFHQLLAVDRSRGYGVCTRELRDVL